MKLFLHWLRWDLRRFRVMLLIWTLLVLGYAAYLGSMQLNALTVKLQWMEWSKPLAVVLLIYLLFVVSAILSADPARGSDAFWRTRPATGRAVAGAKLTILLVFFLGLPLAALGLVRWLSVPPMGDLAVDYGWRWNLYLWTLLSFCLSGLAVAAMSLRVAWQIPVRIGVMYVALVTAGFGTFLLDRPRLELDLPLVTIILGVANPFWIGLGMLVMGAAAYLWPRRPQRPFGYLVWPLLFPLLIILAVVKLPKRPPLTLNPVLPVRTETEAGFQIQGFGTSRGFPVYKIQPSQLENSGKLLASYSTGLTLSGLTDGEAFAVWKQLKLTSQDGRVLQADEEAMAKTKIQTDTRFGNILNVQDAIFDREQARSMALVPCRAEGVIRLLVYRYETAEWPLEAGRALSTPVGTFYRPLPEPGQFSGDLTIHRVNPGDVEITGLIPRRAGIGLAGSLQVTGFGSKNQPFMMDVRVGRDTFQVDPVDKSWRSLREWLSHPDRFVMSDWSLGLRWLCPDCYVDVPVVLTPFVLPRLAGTPPPMDSVLDQVRWPAEGTAVEKRWTLAAWAQLSEQLSPDYKMRDLAVEELQKRLAQVEYNDFPLLQEVLLEYYPESPMQTVFGGPWKQRWFELATAADVEALKANDKAMRFLKPDLIKSGRLVPEKSTKRTMAELTNEELAAWDAEQVGSSRIAELITEALRRGLPWAMDAAAEVIQAKANYLPVYNLLNDFPELLQEKMPPRKLKPWLLENYKKLVFDPVARKWFLPPADKSNPAPVQEN